MKKCLVCQFQNLDERTPSRAHSRKIHFTDNQWPLIKVYWDFHRDLKLLRNHSRAIRLLIICYLCALTHSSLRKEASTVERSESLTTEGVSKIYFRIKHPAITSGSYPSRTLQLPATSLKWGRSITSGRTNTLRWSIWGHSTSRKMLSHPSMFPSKTCRKSRKHMPKSGSTSTNESTTDTWQGKS